MCRTKSYKGGSMTDKEIVQYYGQQWLNVKHMKDYIKQLRKRYEEEEA